MTVAGPGEPELVVVGGIHGDETGGVRAVRRLRAMDLDLQRGVAFVIANPDAVAAGVRYLDSDLNRVFPGNPTGDREQRLAARLCDLITPRTTFSIHGTRSRTEPFALVHRSQPTEFDLASTLPVAHVVDHCGVNDGTITTCGLTVEIEVSPQGTDEAAAMAERQALAFLGQMDALAGQPSEAAPDYYHMYAPLPKPPGDTYEVLVDNFELVTDGTVYATVDGRPLVADEAFYPVMLSGTGYVDIFGYKSRRLGRTLAETRTALAAAG